MWDENGIKYLDLYGGHAVISVGHSHPHYIKRLTNQLNQIGFYSNSVQVPQQKELAEKENSYKNICIVRENRSFVAVLLSRLIHPRI